MQGVFLVFFSFLLLAINYQDEFAMKKSSFMAAADDHITYIFILLRLCNVSKDGAKYIQQASRLPQPVTYIRC